MRMGESLGAEHPLRLATALRVVLPRRDRAVPAGRADLHVHSIWSDGAQAPAAIVRAAAGRVDVLAMTDHDEIRGALEAREFARAHSELGVDVVIGEEVSTLNGHVLALWIEERVPPGLSAERTIALIHDQGGLAVAAHPFHPIPHHRVGYRPLATLIPHLARWLMNKLVRGLALQRKQLIETQQKAEQELAELEERLVAVQAPLEDRLKAYEQRIAELEKGLTAKGEENRELIKATIAIAKKKLEQERSKDRLAWN